MWSSVASWIRSATWVSNPCAISSTELVLARVNNHAASSAGTRANRERLNPKILRNEYNCTGFSPVSAGQGQHFRCFQ
jgi:hypothetical protein